MSQHKLDPKTLLEQELRKPVKEQHNKFIEFLQRVIAANSPNSNITDEEVKVLEHLLSTGQLEAYPEKQRGGYRRCKKRATRRQKTASGSNRRRTRNAIR